MANAILTGQSGGKEIDGRDVTYIAGESLKIGDIVYTIKGEVRDKPYLSPFNTVPYSCVFSPNGKSLVLGGSFAGRAKIYSISGTALTYISDIYADNIGSILGGNILTFTFSPDGKILIVGGTFTGKAKIYSVSETSLTYISDIYADNIGTVLSNTVNFSEFSPNGAVLVLGGIFTGRAKVYSVSETSLTYISDIYADNDNTVLSSSSISCAFSPDSKTLILGGGFTGYAKVYSVSGTSLTYISDIYADNDTTGLSSNVNFCTFSPNGAILVLGGVFTGRAKVYSVSGNVITYVSDIYADNNNIILDNVVYSCEFSPNGAVLVLGGIFTGMAKVYSVSGTSLTYISDIYADNDNTILDNVVRTHAFSPDNKTLVIGGGFASKAKIYSVSGTAITYVSDIYSDNGTTGLNNNINFCTLSPDKSILILGGAFTGGAKLFSVLGTTLTYISDIYADNIGTALNSTVYASTFSPDGNTLILGGFFGGKAKVYSVSGAKIIYISDIYADNNSTVLDKEVRSCVFSPDGAVLVLSGFFTGYAKVYSVSGNVITYVSDIYADNGVTPIYNEVRRCTFSPNGNILVLGGFFTGRAKVYSVSGNVITYVSDIYADNNNTILDNGIESCTFSPNGNVLILGGGFTGMAKVYSVSGTALTYISDIYADNIGTALNSTVYASTFSPDGNTLILGGSFTGRAKVYSVSGTALTYRLDIYADNIGTLLNNSVASIALSIDDNVLILVGNFTGWAKIYSISGTNISYVMKVYKYVLNLFINPDVTGIGIYDIGIVKSNAAKDEEVLVRIIN
jgi:WD40 repeat protein